MAPSDRSTFPTVKISSAAEVVNEALAGLRQARAHRQSLPHPQDDSGVVLAGQMLVTSTVRGKPARRPSLQEREVARLDRREHALEAILIEPVHPLKQSGQQRAVFGENGIIAILEQVRIIDRYLLAGDPAALDAAAQHPVNAAVAVIRAAIAVLAEGAAEFGDDNHDRVAPSGADLLREAGQPAAELPEAISKIAGRSALVDVSVPSAHIDKAEVELLSHQPANATRRELEAAGGNSPSARFHHVVGDRLKHIIADPEAFPDRRRQRVALIHRLDKFHLPRINAGLGHAVDGNVWHRIVALERKRHLVGEGDRSNPGQSAGQPRHEAGTIVARALNGLTKLDCVLRLEMTACHIVRAGEGNEGELSLLVESKNRLSEGRMSSPVRVEW